MKVRMRNILINSSIVNIAIIMCINNYAKTP